MIDHALDYLCAGNKLEQAKRRTVINRLGALHQQSGPPLTYDDLKTFITDTFPTFDDQVLRRAAQLNRPHPISRIAQAGLGTVLGVSAIAIGLWVANRPYPAIRLPLAKTIPILLLPSFKQMDHDYRQASDHLEQARQLIAQATNAQEIGEVRQATAQAEQHLNRLPVWFLDDYPQQYCSWFSCSWQFSQAEFTAIQTQINQVKAQLQQEKAALEQLQSATLNIETAQRRHEVMQTTADKLKARNDWQTGMTQLSHVPLDTFAGKTAQTALKTYQQTYQASIGQPPKLVQVHPAMQAAQQYATQAASTTQNPPHTAETWANAATLWQKAIVQLEQVPDPNPSAAAAKTLHINYTNNLHQIKARQALEQTATQTLDQVHKQAQKLIANRNQPLTPDLLTEFQTVMGQLQSVPPGTTAYAAAQKMFVQVEQQFQDMQAGVKSQNPEQS